jgi:hypothetical protein
MVEKKPSNSDVYLNFGMIAYGSLEEIEKLQKIIKADCQPLRVIYQTVTAKRLYLTKKSNMEKERDLGK